MTKIRLQDNSTEEDDDPGAPEHYNGILSSTASDSDYGSNCGTLRPFTPDHLGKEVSSEATEDNLWPHHISISAVRQHVPGVVAFGHPWTNTPMVSQKATIPLVPKNMFGRTVAEVLHSPDLPDPCLPLPAPYSNQGGHSSTVVTDCVENGQCPSPSLDAGIEEVRRHLGDVLLANNPQRTTETITPALFLVPESQGQHPHSSTNLTEAANQEGIVEGPNTGRELPIVQSRLIQCLASSSEQCSTLEETCRLTQSSTQCSQSPTTNVTITTLRNSVRERLDGSMTVDGVVQERFSPASFRDDDEESGSDQEEQQKSLSGKGSDKGKPQKIYRCPDPWCKATFTRSNDVARHRLTAAIHKRANKNTSTCCRKCGEELSRPDARRRHELKDSCGKRKINRKPPHPLASV